MSNSTDICVPFEVLTKQVGLYTINICTCVCVGIGAAVFLTTVERRSTDVCALI